VKKIGIFFAKLDHISGWTHSNILQELASENHVFVYGEKKIIDYLELNFTIPEGIKIELIVINVPVNSIGRVYYSVRRIITRKISRTFSYNLKKQIFGELNVYSTSFSLSNIIFALIKNLKGVTTFTFRHPFLVIVLLPFIGEFIQKILKILYDKKTHTLPEGINRDLNLFILTSSGREQRIFTLIKSLRQENICTVLSVQNWDNVYSKTVILTEPDYLFVMGVQCAKHALKIQKLKSCLIVPTGLPRFNPFRNIKYNFIQNENQVFKILYLGFSLPHNEVNLLNMLYRELNKINLQHQFEIIYKPHPQRRPRYFEEKATGLFSVISLPTQNYPEIGARHIAQMHEADIVIATPTSMVIESMLLGKKTILDLTNDSTHRTTAQLSYEKNEYLSSLESIKNLEKCLSVNQIVESIIRYINLADRSSIIYNLDHIIENSVSSYSVHINNILTN
jgi:hypothetical protein